MYGNMRFTDLRSDASISPDLRRFLFRFVDFLVKIWEVNALLRRILPEPVALNRLAAPLFVFIFGITILLADAGCFLP